MGLNQYFLLVILLFCFANRIVSTQVVELNRVEIHFETESLEEQNATNSVEDSTPVDLVNLQVLFKSLQKSLHGLQVTLETIKTRQTELHLSLLNITRSTKTPSYAMWKVLRDEKLLLNDIKDVQRDITKMRRFIKYWETKLEILKLEQVVAHEKFSKRVTQIVKELEAAAQDIMTKLKQGQKVLKLDITKMKDHVNVLKSEVKLLVENFNELSQSTTAEKIEISTTESIMAKGESVIQLGKKLQQLKSNVENVKEDVKMTYYLVKIKRNLGNIAQNLSQMLIGISDINLEQLNIESECPVAYPGKGILPVKIEKLHKHIDNSVEIALAVEIKLAGIQDLQKNKPEHLEEIASKLLFLSKNVLEMEGQLEAIANTILDNGQFLVRQGYFTQGLKDRTYIQGEILKNLAVNLENIGENFEEIGKTLSELGTILTDNSEQTFGNLGALLIEHTIK